ncbi:hypothetical protein [Aequorivita capsosiphonis]|uniref:hypothetical protein n=1 Tax=Aequorivita capsosiphonis TaxID=487317 RepID=UPI0012FBDBF8|nr:hypothetical protein [Aequorivita capsosiphonis]
MKSSILKNAVLVVLIYTVTSSCVTLQQPLPRSLWGNWAFVQTGTIINGSNQHLENYRNVCSKKSDRLHFSSDNKISLRRYDEICIIHHYLLGDTT